MARYGFELLANRLREHGADVVFGVPGTQNVHIFEGLRRVGLRTVVPTNEFAAGMMALGWARTRGRTGVLTTIPGPGFALALGALAEADHDSVPLVLLTGTPADGPGDRFQLQRLDQAGMARGMARACLVARTREELPARIDEAFAAAVAGQPGPVLLELTEEALRGQERSDPAVVPPPPLPVEVDAVAERLRQARRPVVLAGAGAVAGADALQRLAAALRLPVVSTPGARGVVPEDTEMAMGFEPTRNGLGHLQALLDEADLVLVLGAKLSHNSTAGFALKLAEETLVQVDASEEVLEANYPASLAVRGDVPGLLRGLLEAGLQPTSWTADELAGWRARLRTPDGMPRAFEPDLPEGVESWEGLFATLQEVLGPEAIVAADSGQHQFLARRYVEIRSPGGLLFPSDFQSMGFGVPAAIGAAVAAPERPVVAVVGDGGFLMSSPEISVAAREGIRLLVLVVNDGHYGLIRAQQISAYGQVHGTRLPGVDLEALSWSLGAHFERVGAEAGPAFRRALEHEGVSVLELPVFDSSAFAAHQVRARVREGVHSVAGPAVTGLKGLIRKLRG